MFLVLYVDDEPSLLEIGKIFLEQDGRFRVDTVDSAKGALGRLTSTRYDAIVSDYQMPGMDGIEFLKRVRASGNSVPFIIFTGRGREEIVIQALNEGADFYIQKGGEPVSQFTELGHKVQKAILQRSAEASIREHERREADIINFLPDATFAIDRQGIVIAWNRAIEKMTGVPADRIIGKGDFEYALPFYRERRPILIDLVLNEDPATAARYPYIKQDGKTFFSEITIPHFNKDRGAVLWFTASPLYDTTGTVVGAIESIREITEWKRTEEALNASERRFRELTDLLPQIVYEADLKGNLTYVNRIAFEIFGYTNEEFRQGLNVIQMIAPTDRERAAAAFRAMAQGQSGTGTAEEFLAQRKDGSTFPIAIYSSPVLVNGSFTGIRGIIVDVSERRRAEERLHESEERFSAFMDHLPVTAFIKDDRFTNLYVNRHMEELFGAKAWIGKTVRELFPPGVAEKMIEDDRLTLQEGCRRTLETLVEKSGNIRTFETHKFRIDRGDRPPLIGGFAMDITEREQAEAALIESEQKYRTVFETTGTATVLLENDGTVSLANSEFARLSGYSKDDIENKKKWTEFVIGEDLERMLVQHRLRRQNPAAALAHYEFRFRTRTGDVRDIYLTIDVIPGTSRSVASLLDITERKQAERNLIAANQEYTNLLTQIQDVYYRSDTEGRLVRASRSWAALLGYDDLSECLGRSIADDFYINPQDRKQFLEEVYRHGKVDNYEVLLKRKDGSPVLVATSSHLTRDPGGNITGVEGTFRDITERKWQEHVLRTQLDLGLRLQVLRDRDEILDACLRAAIEISGMDAGGIYLVDAAGGSVDLAISQNLGEEFLSSISHYAPGSPNVQMVMAERPIYTLYKKSGISYTEAKEREGLQAIAIIPVLWRGRIIACLNISSHTRDEIPEGARIALETIATQTGAAIARFQADEALLKSEERYRNVIEDQTEFICRFRPDGTHVFVNEAYCRYFGLSREEILEHRFRPKIPAEDRSRLERFLESFAPDHPSGIIEHRIIMPDGSVRWQRWSDRAIFDTSGTIIEYQSVGRDVTETKVAQSALQESEERYRTLLMSVNEGIWVIDPQGKTTYVNQKMADMLGYSIDEMIGKAMFWFMDESGKEIAARNFPAYRSGIREQVEFEFLRKDGTHITALVSNTSLFDSSGTFSGVLAAITDITERKRAEEELRESRERFRTIFDNTPLGVAIVGPDFRFRMVNRRFCDMLQYSGDELLDKTFAHITHPDHVAGDVTETRRVFSGQRDTYKTEKRYIRKDGSILWASLTASSVKDKDGSTLYAIALIEDISDRKQAEMVLTQANRKINLLTSITRHDVKNQVTVLRGFTRVLMRKRSDPEIADILARIDASAATIAQQIEFTKEYQELGIHAPAWHRICDIVAGQQTEGIDLSCTCNAEVFADPMIERVIFNIIDNAVRHGERVSAITVSCRPDPGGLAILIDDNGIGIPDDHKELIFEKGYGKHTGFGLFLAREILAITGISLRETGVPGQGARFEIIVPNGMFRMTI